MSQRPRRPNARAALAWGLGLLLAGLAVAAVAVDRRYAELYDPEFALRRDTLHQRLAERPGRPLLAVVGSSRVAMGFAPEELPPLRTAGGAEVLPFNFSHFGSGPVMNLFLVRRLLAEGARPDWLVVELMPQFLSFEDAGFLTHFVAAGEVGTLARYVSPEHFGLKYLGRRLEVTQRLMRQILKVGGPLKFQEQVVPIAPLGGNPFLAGDLSPEERGRRTAAARMACERLTQFEIPAGGDRATRDLIELCRREGIGLVLLLTPEGEAYRSWYPPYARPLLDGYCATLLRETGVTVIDARDWLAEEDFVDSHHADRRGAVAFSRRLGTDVLGPLIQGRIPTPR